MKYRNTKNGIIGTVVEHDEVRKTVLLECDNGKTVPLTTSTLKRWWKPVEDEDEKLVPMPGAEKLAELKEEVEDKAGDGTPLAEVGKEIAAQAKEKAKAAKKPKKETATNAEIPAIIDFINSTAKKAGIQPYIRDKQPKLTNYKRSDGKVLFLTTQSKNKIDLCCKEKELPESIASKMVKFNGFFNIKLSISSLTDVSKELITDIINSFKKEDK